MRTLGLLLCLVSLCGTAAAADPVPIAAFAQPLRYENVRISPDGAYLATDSLSGGRRSLRLMRLADRHTVDVVPREHDEVVAFHWVNARRLLYTVGTKLPGVEQPVPTGELFFVNADGSDRALLFGARAGRFDAGTHIKKLRPEKASATLLDALRRDERNILVWSAGSQLDSGAGEHAVWRMDVVDGARKRLFASPLRYPAGFLADPAGVVRFAYGSNADNIYKVLYRGGGRRDWQVVFDGNAAGGRAEPLAYAADGKTTYWRCQPEGKTGGVCRWSADARELQPVWSSREVESDRLLLDFDGHTLAGVIAEPGKPALTVIDRNAAVIEVLRTLLPRFPGQVVDIVSASDDGSRVVVQVRSDTNPGEWYLFERESGNLQPLFRRAEGIDPARLATMEPLRFNTRDDLTVYGYLTSPPGQETAKNLPVVVLAHGGPYFVRDRWQYDPTVQLLASRGYAVLQVNFRGSEGYGAAFEVAGYREWGGRMQDDLTDATRWLIARGIADPHRICILGTSYGGYAALMGAVREPDLYRCAIGHSGVYDLRLLFREGPLGESPFGRNFLKRVLGEDEDELARRSPVTALDAIKARLMLIAGGQDRTVPPLHSQNLHAALDQRGVAHEWLFRPSEGHGFYGEENRADLYRRLIEFLDASTVP
ncbi:S9 family peptidase [Tahibacter sp.]|uniref:alpha/beta hydrolase family protein n=1 Tax=Tahibacter sp. TaxID=2056211 RepID=UPI0028C411A7|nr:S9 family peptidase [Tahibacter sp.]